MKASTVVKTIVVILAIHIAMFFTFGRSVAQTGTQSKTAIKVGVVLPLTGAGALQGNYVLNAMKLAAEETNNEGGINGRQVEIIAEDDKGVPAESVNATYKLIARDKVLAIIGAYNSSCTLADKEVIGKEKVVLITPVSVAEAITGEPQPFMFRNCATVSMLGGGFARYMIEKKDVKEIALLLENTDYGRGAGEVTTNVFKKYDRKIVGKEFFNIGDTDYYSQLTKFKSLAVKNVLIVGEIKETSLIVKQSNELDFHPQFYSYSNANYPEFLELTGKTSDGLLYVVSFVPFSKKPEVSKFVNTFKAKYNRDPDMMSADGYDAARIVIEAIRKAGIEYKDLALWRKKVRDSMYEISYVGVHGPVKFDEKGQAQVDGMVVQIKNMKRIVVFP